MAAALFSERRRRRLSVWMVMRSGLSKTRVMRVPRSMQDEARFVLPLVRSLRLGVLSSPLSSEDQGIIIYAKAARLALAPVSHRRSHWGFFS